jgi:uncharacterized membrane protein
MSDMTGNDNSESDFDDAAADTKIFSAVITPHRSLSPTGFLIFIICLSGLSFISGVAFVLMGAWPVCGFLGLDVLLVYVAFRASYRSGRAYEEVTVTASEITVRRVNHRGGVREFTLNPLWARLDRVAHEEFGIERLFLVSHGRQFPIAGFLGPDEKASFARALTNALGEARRGPTWTVLK